MHTILGAGGPIANALQLELLNFQQQVKLVSRREIVPPAGVSWERADLLNRDQILNVTRDASVIYLCAGLKYDKAVWKEQWPVIMRNVIEAANANHARLIFFDNVYMYGKVNGPMTEDSPVQPQSAKGKVRAAIAEQLLKEMRAGNLRGSIARAADFYGASSMNSVFDSMVMARYAKKQKAMWIGDANKLHSFTYVPDAAKAVAFLGMHPESDNQIWHLPTAPAITGRELMILASSVYDTKPVFMEVKKLMLKFLGFFNKTIAESTEMYYQYEYDYVFDSSKIENVFGLKATSYTSGIK